jgi:hypothetical protein
MFGKLCPRESRLVTYAKAPFGVMATPKGELPTLTVATTVFVAVAITDTVFETLFVTYAKAPFGVMATPCGSTPTATVATTVFVAVAITDTVFEELILKVGGLPPFVTYAKAPSGVMATLAG